MTIAVIQARMSSSRFPGKSLALLGGDPIYLWCLRAAARAKNVNEVILATSDDESDDPLAADAEKRGWPVWRGDLQNVRKRTYNASRGHDVVVRITGDCPLVRTEDIEELVGVFLSQDCDYVTNTMPPVRPDGQDIEVFKRRLLMDADKEIDDLHVTSHFRRNRDRYDCINVGVPENVDCSLAVDDPEDLVALELFMLDSTLPKKRRNLGIVQDFIRQLDEAHPRPKIDVQQAFRKKVEKIIPGGAQTFSKMPHVWSDGFGPSFQVAIQGGKESYGATIIDLDGNHYTDYILGLGAVTVGHGMGSQPVNCPTLPAPTEYEVAKKLLKCFPNSDMVRFFKNGTDATVAAARLARHVTERMKIVSYGYHGWADTWVTVDAFGPKASGSIGHTLVHCENLNDVAGQVDETVAAVIVEPANQQYLTRETARELRDVCNAKGAILIFDEIVTFPRFGLHGIQEMLNVKPDLTTVGKGMANGAPISALVGTRQVMQHYTEIFASGTFGGELAGLLATLQTLDTLREIDYPTQVLLYGQHMQMEYNLMRAKWDLCRETECVGLPYWPIITWRTGEYTALEYSSFFQQECLRRGVTYNGNLFFCCSHTALDIEDTLKVFYEALRMMRMAIDYGILDKVIIGKVNTGGVRHA